VIVLYTAKQAFSEPRDHGLTKRHSQIFSVERIWVCPKQTRSKSQDLAMGLARRG